MILSNLTFKKIAVSICSCISIIFAFLTVFLSSGSGAIYTLALDTLELQNSIFLWVIVGASSLTVLLSLITIVLQLFNKKIKTLVLLNTIISLVGMIFTILVGNLNIIYPILGFAFSFLISIYSVIFEIKNKDDIEKSSNKNINGSIFSSIISFISILCLFSIFLIPICFYNNTAYYTLLTGLQNIQSEEEYLLFLISFIAFFALYIFVLIGFTQSLVYFKNTNKFLEKTRVLIGFELGLSILFFFYSIIISYLEKDKQSYVTSISNISYIPLVVTSYIAIVNSIFSSKYITLDEKDNRDANLKLKNRLLTLVFTILFLGLLTGSVFSNILVITYTYNSVSQVVTVNGLDVLQNYQSMDSGYKILAFFIYIILVFSIVSLVVSLSLFFRKSTYFYKYSFFSVCAAFVLIIVLSLFSKYYEIVKGIQTDAIKQILSNKGLNISVDYDSKVSSQCLYFALAGLALVVVMIFLKPFSNKVREEALDVNINNDLSSINTAPQVIEAPKEEVKEESKDEEVEEKEEKLKDFDPCPAFSEIDALEDSFTKDFRTRKSQLFSNPTLPSIVSFVVEYARDSRLHLSYKEEDIAQFVAGLGSSRLSILQGMSGTGKTSLPKIFTESLFGNCNIIEVESSWKDKNELIGYYNEFSEKFTPKKFTQALYQAKFMPDVITLIVLDEMNLSRIEYYFSDFLSLMENEEDKREIKLLNVQLKSIKDGEYKEYKKLNNGHTIKIPTNVWFIGTANKDESTFEISDKVYDRAMTMNFTSRAPKVKFYNSPISKKFLTYTDFKKLIENAKKNYKFDCEDNEIVKQVEKIVAPFNISFGNRILNQIESFVSIYCSCFTEPQKKENEALEKILLTKVVQKLETKSIENKEELVHAFEKIGLLRCADFISKLNEDI